MVEGIIMKWRVGTLAVTGLACALGCSVGDISSEGKILHVVTYKPRENAHSEAIQEVERTIRGIPSKAPTMERFEWGRTDYNDSPQSYFLLVLFNDPQSAYHDLSYNRATRDVIHLNDLGSLFVMGNSETYLLHDATPHMRNTTHGHLRRVVWIRLKPNATLEEMQKFEDAIAALPNRIPTIERLEWGARTGYDPLKPKPIDPAYRNGNYCLLFTFDGTVARDACLAHPAYEEFQSVLEPYVARQFEREFVSQVEYIPRPD
jgi:hypothetical protein